MTDWLHAVSDGRQHNEIRQGTMTQEWILLTCPDCANVGPWRVFVAAGEVFLCSVCRRQMRHVEEDADAT